MLAAMGERSLLSLGFHVSVHSGNQSLEPCGRQFSISGYHMWYSHYIGNDTEDRKTAK